MGRGDYVHALMQNCMYFVRFFLFSMLSDPHAKK